MNCAPCYDNTMDTRSKSVSTPANPIDIDLNMPAVKKLENMSVDEKLNVLIVGMQKLETVPSDIVSMKNSIDEIQKEIKEIPEIQTKIVRIEADIEEQKEKVAKTDKTCEAIEVSLTATQKDVDDFNKQAQSLQSQLDDNKKRIASFEKKLAQDEQKIKDLTKKALEEEKIKANIAAMIEIQGVPESTSENLRQIVRQIFYDTGVAVDPKEIDQVYREGNYSKRRARAIIVTLTKISTRNELLKHRLVIKQNPNCKDIWLNEVVLDQVRTQRNELHALHLLALNKGHDSRHIQDVLIVDGITYSHSSIHRLPVGINLEAAYTREYEDAIYFNSEHVFMSNFSPCSITLEDATCSCLEQAYFFLMAKDLGNQKVAQLILNTDLPREIKKIGSSLVATIEWRNKAPQVMYDLLKLKYQQNPKLKEKLIATGTKRLFESTQSKYWGCGLTIQMIDRQQKQQGRIKTNGKNILGEQTEDIRREILETVEKQDQIEFELDI